MLKNGLEQRNDNHSVCAPTAFLFLSTLNARHPPTKTAKATIEMIIVASALTSGFTPRRTFEKITIGRVVEPGPYTNLAMTRSSTDWLTARSQPDTRAGDTTGSVTSVISPALVSGWLLAFTLSLDDLVISSFVSGPGSTGLGLPGHEERWQRILEQTGRPERIVITHFHPDHVGGAATVASITEAPVFQGELDYEDCRRAWKAVAAERSEQHMV